MVEAGPDSPMSQPCQFGVPVMQPCHHTELEAARFRLDLQMGNQRHCLSGSLSAFGKCEVLRALHRLRVTKQVLSSGRKTCQKS